MNDITKYVFQDSEEIRTVVTEDGMNFNAKDVCKALGYKNPSKAVHDHVSAKGVTQQEIITAGGIAEANYITESGLYSLLIGSKMKRAKEFKDWVVEVVLPSIRKTGSYTPSTGKLSDMLLVAYNKALEEEKQAEGLEDMRVKAIAYEDFLKSDGAFTFIEVAKILGTSERVVVDVCVASALISKLPGSGMFMPREEHLEKGYFQIKDVKKGGALAIKVLVTAQGVDHIKGLLPK